MKDFPTLYLMENRAYGKAAPDQKVAYCKIQQIIVQETGVLALLKVISSFPQDILNQNVQLLGINGKWSHDLHELNRSHWAVKKINLYVLMQMLGIHLPYQRESAPKS